MPTLPNACVFPSLVCWHYQPLVYLIPAMLLAFVFRSLTRCHVAFSLLCLPGTLLHELAHLVAGLLTNAKPVAFSIFPRRSGRAWVLGSVSFSNIRWYNAAFVGLAPLSTIMVPFAVAAWRIKGGLSFQWADLAIAVLLAPLFISFLPSATDLKLSLYSWPYAIAACGLTWWLMR